MARSEGWAVWARLPKRSQAAVVGGWVLRSPCSWAQPLPNGGVACLSEHPCVLSALPRCCSRHLGLRLCSISLPGGAAFESWMSVRWHGSSSRTFWTRGVILSKQTVLGCDLRLSDEPVSVTCFFQG